MSVTNAEFLAAIMPPMLPGEYGWWCAWRGDPHDKRKPHDGGFNWTGRPFEVPEAVGGQANQNTYFSVALLRGEVQGRKARQKATFSRLFCIVQDEGEPVDGLEPTWILQTSTKNGVPNLQVGYRLAEPVTDPAVADRLHKGLAASGRIKADRAGNNIVRYVRLPTGSNGKYDPPHPHKLLTFNPDRVVTLSEFCAAAGIDLGRVLSGDRPQAPAARAEAPQGEDGDAFAAQVAAAAASGRFAKASGEGDAGSIADLGGRTPAMWRAHAVKCATDAARWTHDDPTMGRHQAVLTLGGNLGRDGVPAEHLDAALRVFEVAMRPTDASGELVGMDWGAERDAIQWAWERGRAEPRQKTTESPQGDGLSGADDDAELGQHDLESLLEAYNEKYFVAQAGVNVYIFDSKAKSVYASALRKDAFQLLCAPDRTPSGKSSVADVWLSWRRRRTATSFTMDPTRKPGLNPNGEFNLFGGIDATPVKGDCSLILRHIHEVWCDSDPELYRYVIGWMAHLFQRPWEKPGVALVLKSVEGTGKSTISELLIRMCGRHGFISTTKDSVVGRFNGHLADKLLIVLEESFHAGDPEAAARLKGLVTNSPLGFENKNMPAETLPSFSRIITIGNNDWGVRVGLEARRFCVLNVSDRHIGNKGYFDALHKQIAEGGAEAFAHHLLHEVDLTGLDIRKAPETRGLAEQKLLTVRSSDAPLSWLLSALEAGGFTVDGCIREWKTTVETGTILSSYAEHARRFSHAPVANVAIREIHKRLPGLIMRTKVRHGGGGQMPMYKLMPLESAREFFHEKTGLQVEADAEHDDDLPVTS